MNIASTKAIKAREMRTHLISILINQNKIRFIEIIFGFGFGFVYIGILEFFF